MDAINSLGKNITMILDAHHLNTLKKYDKSINLFKKTDFFNLNVNKIFFLLA